MEFTKEVITWILITIATNLSAVVLAILSWVKAAKMLPKELKGSDLDNKSKEISIAEQYDEMATRAAQKTLDLQNKLDCLEINFNEIKKSYETLSLSCEKLSSRIGEQDEIIKKQSETINMQTMRLNEQEGEISSLRADLLLSQEYSQLLVNEMKLRNLTPPEPPKKQKKKNGNGNSEENQT